MLYTSSERNVNLKIELIDLFRHCQMVTLNQYYKS